MSSNVYDRLQAYRDAKEKTKNNHVRPRTAKIESNSDKTEIRSSSSSKSQTKTNVHWKSLQLILDPLSNFLIGTVLREKLNYSEKDLDLITKILEILTIILIGFLAKIYHLLPPYLVILAVLLIWKFGFSDEAKKRKGKLSAYSVFNPNFERIQGEFNAEKFEGQMRSGMK